MYLVVRAIWYMYKTRIEELVISSHSSNHSFQQRDGAYPSIFCVSIYRNRRPTGDSPGYRHVQVIFYFFIIIITSLF